MTMDEERQKKIEAGRQKLEAYKTKKSSGKSDSEHNSLSHSDSSLCLSPLALPDNAANALQDDKANDESEPSSISENIVVSSLENDRSLHEIVISNIPVSSPEPSVNSVMFKNTEVNVKSLSNSLLSETSFISLHALEIFENMNENDNFQNILDEIIKLDDFKTNDCSKSVLCDELSTDTLKNDTLDGTILIEIKCENDNEGKSGGIDALLSAKDLFPLGADIDSLREINSSNHSTTSLGTSTDYKFYHDKSFTGSVEYQDMLSHRDDHIQQLTVALEQVLQDRNRLQDQAEHSAHEIDLLKEQLVQAITVIKKHNFNTTPVDSDNENPGGAQELDKEHVPDMSESVKSFSEKDTLSKLIRISDINFDSESIPFEDSLSPEELDIIQDIRCKINFYLDKKMQESKMVHNLELKILEDQLVTEKTDHLLETAKLREMLAMVKSGSADIDALRKELNEKHSREMEELRTYFEERCAEIEKHYSEEIFSQQSRKMSAGSSICSELESEVYPGAQCAPSGDSPAVGSDPASARLELQNKYHAELEILREDYENRIDELRINNENVQQELEQKYSEQMEALKLDLEEAQKYVMTQQEVASSGDFEIAEVVQSYERRLQEQVMLAKVDIISALELQIQNLITNSSKDNEWPTELLQLREIIITQVKEQHIEEINAMKEDYEKKLSRAIEREKRNSLQGDELELKKERDSLKKVTSYLRNLLAELMKYFTKCEDELNNTLVEELLKQGIDKDLSKLDMDLNDSFQSGGSDKLELSTASTQVKRVHFTPDVSGIISLIDETHQENVDMAKEISTEFQTELQLCLERLKSEANAILLATGSLKPSLSDSGNKNPEERLSSLTRRLITEKQAKNDLSLQLDDAREYIQNLELHKVSIEGQLDQITAKQHHLLAELDKAKEKIIDLVETGRKEIVSEGYGENHITGSSTLGERVASLAELQERARGMLCEGSSCSPLLQLVEELCVEGDRIMDDAKKDHDDLIQQIEAADKKLRATTQFLEEQAVERENERDEAQKEIAVLREQLRAGERTRSTCDRINTEVERLEGQMREMSTLMTQSECKKAEVESELKEAIDKIWVLRDIIRDLESQIEIQTKAELDLKNIATQLQNKIKEQVKHNEELGAELESFKNGDTDDHLNQHILELEDEVSRLRVSSELAGPDGLTKQVKSQLYEIERIIEKRTKDLEALHSEISNTNCSSPSEDMSIRDQVCCASSSGGFGDADLPLEQLARLKDKLVRHSRAEDAAMKRIRDLEMQLFTAKQEYEEMQGERDVLQEQLSEQMHIISSLQLRLDEQRLRVESVQKETNTALEHRVYELQNEVQALNEKVHVRDKSIKQLNAIVDQTKSLLADQQKQLNSTSDLDKELIDQLHKETENLRSENMSLKNKIQNDIKFNQSISTPDIPELLDSMLSEKNADLDRLRSQLADVKQELDLYKSLHVNKEQLVDFNDSCGRITSLVSSHDEPDQIRKEEQSFDSFHSNDHLGFRRIDKNDTVFVGSSFRDSKYSAGKNHSPFLVPEVSTIEKLGPFNLNTAEFHMRHVDYPSSLPCNSTKNKQVRFEDCCIEKLEEKVKQLQEELAVKNASLRDFEETLASTSEYMVDVRHLRQKLEYSEDTLKETKESLTDEIDCLKEQERQVRLDLAEAKMILQEQAYRMEDLEKEANRKERMCISITKDKHELHNQITELESKLTTFSNYETQLVEKNKEIFFLEQQLAEANDLSQVDSLREKLEEADKEITNFRKKIANLEANSKVKDHEIQNIKYSLNKVEEELANKNDAVSKYAKECQNMASQCEELSAQIDSLEETLKNKNLAISELEQFVENERESREDVTPYQNKIMELQNLCSDLQYKMEATQKESLHKTQKEIQFLEVRHKKELAERDLKQNKTDTLLDELKKETHHLQDFINQKDKIIMQMTRDSNSLHVSLEAIQSKIQESGNVIDLKKRLRDEQNLTAALHDELQFLKQRLSECDMRIDQEATEIIQDLKTNLEKEHALNGELLNIRDGLLQEIHIWEQKFETERDAVSRLTLLLDTEKQNSNTIQLQDANIIESMRERLEQALDHENDLEKLLDAERKAKEDIHRKTGAVSLESGVKMNDAHFELACVKMDLVKAKTENDILKSEFLTLNNLNSLLKADLQQTKQLTELQKAEIEELKERLNNLKDAEQTQKDKNERKKHEIVQRNMEIENSRGLLNELEQERNDMRKQIEELRYNIDKCHQREYELKEMLNRERESIMNTPVPEKFLTKMKELSNMLQDNVSENSEMAAVIHNLEEEKKKLQSKIRDLERNRSKPPFDDTAARADHLFGKYLKAESFRKALIFQKRYFITLLATYQRCPIEKAVDLQYVWPKSSYPESRGISRFRSAVYVVIAVHRMHFIVQRWQSGKRERGGSTATLHRPLSRLAAGDLSSDVRPWYGNSPPCKDRVGRRNRDAPLGNIIKDSVALSPLQAPQLLSQYMDRFDNIQQRLGLVSDQASS